MQFFYKVVTSGAEVNLATYSVLLKNLLAAGNWRKYVEVVPLELLVNIFLLSVKRNDPFAVALDLSLFFFFRDNS